MLKSLRKRFGIRMKLAEGGTMNQAEVLMRLEGHLYVKNGAGRSINARVVGDGDQVKADFTPSHDTTMHFTIYKGNDLWPGESYLVDVYVTNKDTSKTWKLSRRFRQTSAYTASLLVTDGRSNPDELEFIFVDLMPSYIKSETTRVDRKD
jgi:hypothetical protein